MAALITTLRGLTNAAAAEYTVNATAYWTDDQLQTVLDRHVAQIRHEELSPIQQVGVGTISYFDYQSTRRFFETTDTGTSRFIVQDHTGATIGTAAYTVDYPRGMITFGTSTVGQTRYLTGFSYDMNASAADVWTQKAAHYVTAYDVSTDNHSLKRSQIIANCMSLAKEFGAGVAVRYVSVDRSDTGGD
jgi:hypothetical protein